MRQPRDKWLVVVVAPSCLRCKHEMVAPTQVAIRFGSNMCVCVSPAIDSVSVAV